MPSELTNLLPQDRQRALARDYRLRLCVVAAVLVSALMFAAAALLLPTYVFLIKSAAAKEARLANMESVLSSVQEKELSARLAALAVDAKALIALENIPAVSAVVRSVLDIARPGVKLSGFSYSLAQGSESATITVSGIAATRDALRSYQLALQNAPFAQMATLPVSAYAKDTDIGFRITITLMP